MVSFNHPTIGLNSKCQVQSYCLLNIQFVFITEWNATRYLNRILLDNDNTSNKGECGPFQNLGNNLSNNNMLHFAFTIENFKT